MEKVLNLNNIDIKGFKSIKDTNLELGPINIIIGPNGVGKSNFISVFEFLNAIVNKNLQHFIIRKGGAEHFLHFGSKITNQIDISITVSSANKYTLKLIPANPDTLMIKEDIVFYIPKGNWDKITENAYESILSDATKTSYKAYYLVNYLSNIRIYHFHDVGDNAPVKKYSSLSDNIFLQSQADNLSSMLYLFKKNYQAEYCYIVSVIKMVAPFFQDFVLEPENNKILLRWKHVDYEKIFDIYDLSDGTLRFIELATLLLQPDSFIPNTVIIDEPELGLHPYALKILAELFQNVSKKGKQIIATSQSVEFINEFNFQNIIVADRQKEVSCFRHLKEEEVKEWLEEFSIGDIWNKNIIGGNPND